MEEKLILRLEAAVARLEAFSSGNLQGISSDNDTESAVASADPAMVAYDELMEKFVGRVSSTAEKIGGKVKEATKILEEAFKTQKDLLTRFKQTEKPKQEGLAEYLKPLNEVILQAISLTEGRRSDFFNHLKAVADSLTALAWLAYLGKDCGMSLPIGHVEESWQMAEFYNNKVLVEYKVKDLNHVEWAKALKELYLPGLRDYVKRFYPLGPVWCSINSPTLTSTCSPSKPTFNTTPSKPAPTTTFPSTYSPSRSSAPPPPPPPAFVISDIAPLRPKVGMSAVFQEINSGKSVTEGLKKVTDDMKTKNRTDRTSVVGATEKEPRSIARSFSKLGPPKLELQMGRKWMVENQIGRKNLVIDDCDPKQSVYVFECKDSVLQLKGKVNNITIDKCTKMGIVFTDVVSACEIVNCNSVEIQCQGSAPSISIDNTAGCQLYLGKDSLRASITTAKSSEINVLISDGSSSTEWVEFSLPQQFVHVFQNGQFTTTPATHSGG